jgi:hypothetical protein
MELSIIPRMLIILLTILGLAGLAGCNLPRDSQNTAATLNVTEAYQTVEARLTEAVALTPPATLEPQPTDSGIIPQTPTSPPTTSTPNAPTVTAESSTQCDQAAAGNPIDVTIPDNTEMKPEQTFTKIWRLKNTGTCTWTKDYSLILFSGEAMGAPTTIHLNTNVAPNQILEISVDMVAPQSAGTYRGNWKLRNANNIEFGIGPNGNSPFWVQIIVVPLPTASPTPTTITPTPTPTATPVVQTSGSVVLHPGDRIDLDNNQLNSGSGDDLVYDSDPEGKHILTPQGNNLIGIYGANQPSMAGCQAATLSNTSITMDDISMSTYLCYQTNQGLPGRALVANFNTSDYSLTLDILTWSLP